MHCDHFLIYCALYLSCSHCRIIHNCALVATEKPNSEGDRNLERYVRKFCLSVSLSYLKGSLICRKSYDIGPTALLPSERSRATDFMALMNPSLLAGSEPANLGSNGKHDNHYTTEDDWCGARSGAQLYLHHLR
jgi:hypothetical protein